MTGVVRGFALNNNVYLLIRVNPLVPNAPFLYPLKTSENRNVFRCFQKVEKECMGNKWVNGA